MALGELKIDSKNQNDSQPSSELVHRVIWTTAASRVHSLPASGFPRRGS